VYTIEDLDFYGLDLLAQISSAGMHKTFKCHLLTIIWLVLELSREPPLLFSIRALLLTSPYLSF